MKRIKEFKERDIMAVMTKPVKKAMITSEEGAAKMQKNVNKAVIDRILKNTERVNKQIVKK